MTKKPSRQEQVKALLLIHNIPVFGTNTARRPGCSASYMNSGDPFTLASEYLMTNTPCILVSEYLMSSDHTAYQLSKPTILIELRGLGEGFHVIDQDDGTDDPFDRADIIERLVNKLDNRKLGLLQRKLFNLPS